MTLCSPVDILDIVGSGFKVARGIVALGNEDVVLNTTLQWLVQWDRWSLERI